MAHVAPPVRRVYQQAPTAGDLLTDPVVDHALKQAWNDSRPSAPEVPRGATGSIKQQQGGWLVWDRTSGHVSAIRVPAGTRDSLATMAGTRPKESERHQVVGWFRTSPNTTAEGYAGGTSPADVGWQNAHAKAPGLIETHEGRKTIPHR